MQNKNTNHHKLIILGSGPAGLTAAIYSSRANLTPLIITGKNPGGQLMGTNSVENWPGNTSIPGPKLMMNMQEHAAHFGARWRHRATGAACPSPRGSHTVHRRARPPPARRPLRAHPPPPPRPDILRKPEASAPAAAPAAPASAAAAEPSAAAAAAAAAPSPAAPAGSS